MTNNAVLVDSNILLDLLDEQNAWTDWSADQIDRLIVGHRLIVNPIIYAEIAYGYPHEQMLNQALNALTIEYAPIPSAAAFLASKSHKRYRDSGGARTATLPDFFIGAHAEIDNLTLLTRDVRRYNTYFPTVKLISPEA